MYYPVRTLYLLATSNLLLGILGAELVPCGVVPYGGYMPNKYFIELMPQAFIFSLDII